MEKFLENPRHVEVQVIADGQAVRSTWWAWLFNAASPPESGWRSASSVSLKRCVNIPGERCTRACLEIGYRGAGTFEFYTKWRILLHRNEHSYSSRAPSNRDGNWRWPNQRATTCCCLSTPIFHARRYQDQRPSWSNVVSTRKIQRSSYLHRKIERFHALVVWAFKLGLSHLHGPASTHHTTIQWFVRLITYGENRDVAISRMKNALGEMIVEGIKVNISLQEAIMNDENFQHGGANIHYLEKKLLLVFNRTSLV